MFEPSRFVPASIDAFRRAAKDLQRAYALPLQVSQEALARIYAYPDLHAVQEHLKQRPVPGPFDEDIDAREADRRDYIAGITISDFVGPGIGATGHLAASDLKLFATPEARRAHMDFERHLGSVVQGEKYQIDTGSVADYVTFEVRKPSILHGRSAEEGVFRLTQKGLAMRRIVNHLVAGSEDGHSFEQHSQLTMSLLNLSVAFANDPLSKAELARLEHKMMLLIAAGSGEPDADLAKLALLRCKTVRAALESLMPSRFVGLIEPELVGDGIQNAPYMTTLAIGTECAYLLEQDRTAKAWGRRYLLLHPRDSFGVRFILEKIGVEQPSRPRDE